MGRYLEDTFSDTNGTLLTAHTIPTKRASQTWSVDNAGPSDTGAANSDATIQSNALSIGTSGRVCLVDVGATTYVLGVNWTVGGSSGHRIIIPVWRTDKNNFIYVLFREPDDDVQVYKVVAGVQTSLATAAVTLATSTTYAIKVTVKAGSLLDVSVDGVAKHSNIDISAVSATSVCGVGTAYNPGGAAVFDTFSITNGVTNAVASATSIKPGANHALTFTGFVAAPSTITYNAVGEAFTGTPTTSAGTMLAIPLGDFAPAGDHVATRWMVDNTLTVSDGIDSASVSVQVDPDLTPNAEDFTLTSGASDVDDYNPVPGAVGGDDFFTYWHTGDGVRNQSIAGLSDAGSGYMVPSTLPAQGRRMAYDASAGAWLGYVDTEFFVVSTSVSFVSISTVREGTDPPATDVVPDANLTTLGPLGWYRQSESGLAVTNSKSGGSHNGSVSDIGSPAWLYYAGSNNKQASLAPYTDGVSPVSSAGTRAYRIATANGTGARITIPLAGQSVKVLLFHGGYASTSRVAASLSDASAAAVQSDFVTGAATVGWWRTTILAYAAGTANLVIDLTSITGGNAQFLGYAVDYGTPVLRALVASDDTVTPGQTITLTVLPALTGSITAGTLAGVAFTPGSPDTDSCTLTIPGENEFDDTGAHVATPWYENIPITVTDGTDTVEGTLQIVAAVPENFGTAGASPVYPPVGLSIGDDVYVDVVSGTGSADPEGVDYSAATSSVVRFRAFNQNSALWLAYREESIAAASTGGGTSMRIYLSISLGL